MSDDQLAVALRRVLPELLADEEIRPVGYFPMSEEAINEEKREFLEATSQ